MEVDVTVDKETLSDLLEVSGCREYTDIAGLLKSRLKV